MARRSFYVAERTPEICAFNNIVQLLKWGFRSSREVNLRCAHHPKSITIPGSTTFDTQISIERTLGPLLLAFCLVFLLNPSPQCFIRILGSIYELFSFYSVDKLDFFSSLQYYYFLLHGITFERRLDHRPKLRSWYRGGKGRGWQSGSFLLITLF